MRGAPKTAPGHTITPTDEQCKPVDTQDGLLLCLMSSEAMVDSRGYVILNPEEVEELKKVRVPFQYQCRTPLLLMVNTAHTL
jgi:hypothetical protein